MGKTLQDFTEEELRNSLDATERIAPGSEGSRAIRRELERREAGGRPCRCCPYRDKKAGRASR